MFEILANKCSTVMARCTISRLNRSTSCALVQSVYTDSNVPGVMEIVGTVKRWYQGAKLYAPVKCKESNSEH